MTRYVILKRDDDPVAGEGDGRPWLALTHAVEARSALEAVRKQGAQGVFVAVPIRSWQPLELTTTTRTTVAKATP